MGQKINPNALRLGKRTTWNSTWATTKSAYASMFFSGAELKHYHTFLLNSLGFFTNNILVRKSCQKLQLYGNILTDASFAPLSTVSMSKRLKTFRCQQTLAPHLINKTSFSLLDHSCSTILNVNGEQRKNKKLTLSFLLAQAVCEYIAVQILRPVSLKDSHFKTNLLRGITKLLDKILTTSTITSILGVKIACAGKWKKTKSGRKQKISFTLGRLKTQSVKSITSYGYSTVSTKYGSCGIKVWIAYNKM
jgi:hypothetical protein